MLKLYIWHLLKKGVNQTNFIYQKIETKLYE